MNSDFIVKSMAEICRQEYILYEWIAVINLADQPPVLIRGKMRTPREARIAADEFDVWLKAYRAFNPPKVDIDININAFRPSILGDPYWP